MSIIIIIIVIT